MAEQQEGQVDDKLNEMLDELSEETRRTKPPRRSTAPATPKDEEEDEEKKTTEAARSSPFDVRHLAAYAALVASTAGLVNSFVAYKKANEEVVARETYKVTTLAIERLSDETQINHGEIVSLRQYLLDHIASGNVAQQLDPPPPPPPVIESRPAPIVVSQGKGGRRSFPARPSASAAPPAPVPTVAASAVAARPPSPREPARMPSEWADPI